METITTKFTSGRFLSVIAFTLTMCYISIVEPSVRDAFFALAGAILRDYYMMKRTDEAKPQGEVKP